MSTNGPFANGPLLYHPEWAADPALLEVDERDLGPPIAEMTPPGICLAEGALVAKDELVEAVRVATLANWANSLPVHGVAPENQVTNPLVAIEVAKRYFEQWLNKPAVVLYAFLLGFPSPNAKSKRALIDDFIAYGVRPIRIELLANWMKRFQAVKAGHPDPGP